MQFNRLMLKDLAACAVLSAYAALGAHTSRRIEQWFPV